jgi:hypothetical protein
MTPARRELMNAAIDRLNKALGEGTATLVIGATGGIAFGGWTDRQGVSDLCAYRKLAATNSPELRRAMARAEVKSGRALARRRADLGHALTEIRPGNRAGCSACARTWAQPERSAHHQENDNGSRHLWPWAGQSLRKILHACHTAE